MRDTVSICGTHELGFKRCARTRYAGRVVTLAQLQQWTVLIIRYYVYRQTDIFHSYEKR